MIKKFFTILALSLVTAVISHAAEAGQNQTRNPRFLPDYHSLHGVNLEPKPVEDPFGREATQVGLDAMHLLQPAER